MNILNYVYRMRKRIDDKTLLKIKHIVDEETERRKENDESQVYAKE